MALSPELSPAKTAALDRSIQLVAGELRAVEGRLATMLSSSIAIIPEVGCHLAFAGGKRFRPLVALLGARAAGFEADVRITVAAVGELLHTATLLHDDVIDHGEFRRGRPAARLRYGNGMAVLTGDFCLARALQAMSDTGKIEAVQTMSEAVTRMAEGEVAQLHVAGEYSLERDRYYMVIDRKTAALIAWCSSVASLIEPDYSEALHRYGLELGYAFQIADDVLDYAYGVERTGKRRGQDLRDGKMTLPLVLACERDKELAALVQTTLRKGPPIADSVVDTIIERVIESEALLGATAIAEDHSRQACAALGLLPQSAAREALTDLARFVSRRAN